jgi:hypothetical protein
LQHFASITHCIDEAVLEARSLSVEVLLTLPEDVLLVLLVELLLLLISASGAGGATATFRGIPRGRAGGHVHKRSCLSHRGHDASYTISTGLRPGFSRDLLLLARPSRCITCPRLFGGTKSWGKELSWRCCHAVNKTTSRTKLRVVVRPNLRHSITWNACRRAIPNPLLRCAPLRSADK